MANDDVLKYMREKEEYIENDFKLRFWVEILFFNHQQITYDERAKNCLKKLQDSSVNALKMKKFLNTNPFKRANRKGIKMYHLASTSGFMRSEEVFMNKESSSYSNEDQSKIFLNVFENMVMDKKFLPNKSVIVLDQSKHHMTKTKRKAATVLTPSKRKQFMNGASTSKKITDFFPKTKNPSIGEATKPKEPPTFTFRVEEILYKHRQEDVKLLWLPQGHTELDAVNITSIFFCSKVAQLLEDNDTLSAEDAMPKMISEFPTDEWITVFKRVKEYEHEFKKDNGLNDVVIDEEEEEEIEDKEENE